MIKVNFAQYEVAVTATLFEVDCRPEDKGQVCRL